jgi:hypothetical protein
MARAIAGTAGTDVHWSIRTRDEEEEEEEKKGSRTVRSLANGGVLKFLEVYFASLHP